MGEDSSLGRSGGWSGVIERVEGGVSAICRAAAVGAGDVRALDGAYIWVAVAGRDDVPGCVVVGEAVREEYVARGADGTGASAGGGIEYQSAGVVSGDRGSGADVVDR